jgi:glycosyltransferase involved in cell wall biosynthesis
MTRRAVTMYPECFFSVLIPTYNRARELERAINSVLSQTYRKFEIIVVDDGSRDSTADVVNAIIEKGPKAAIPQVRYFYQSNKGQSAARNKGVAEAMGNWIAFLDSDDIWLPNKLDWQVRAIEQFQGNCAAYFTDAHLIDSKGLETTAFQQAGRHYDDLMAVVTDPVRSLAKAFGGSWVQTLVARSELVRQIGGFDPDLHFAEDYDFLFRLSLRTAHCYINKPLVIIDRTTAIIDPTVASRSWDRVDFRLRAQQCILEKWLTLQAEYPDDVRRTVIQNLRGVHSGWTNWYLEQRQYDKARQSVSTAMKYQITPELAIKWVLSWLAPGIARRIAPKSTAML